MQSCLEKIEGSGVLLHFERKLIPLGFIAELETPYGLLLICRLPM